jgi:hypothetical protein
MIERERLKLDVGGGCEFRSSVRLRVSLDKGFESPWY